ncbi:pilus assembly protein PilM [Lentibacillus sp. N15]|uniref:type IV pilus biogenesis protein PilM n=1 Tax=Lentibacillus songyuanensis TaxID=3136161 RepID=UPI0031B9FAE6
MKDRVNMVVTNHALRYTYHKQPTRDGLVTYGEMEIPPDSIQDGMVVNKAGIVAALKQLVQQHKWKRKKVIFSIPDDTVVIRQMQIPASLTKEEANGYIQTQIGNRVYLPFADPALAIDFLDKDEENRNILLFAYPREKIASFVSLFSEAGLKPVAADLTSLCVYRYYYLHQPDDKEHILHIHWNQDALVQTAFQHHKPVFTRSMKFEWSVTEPNDMVEKLINEYILEINRIIDFYHYSITNGEAQINKLLLTGDFPLLAMVNTSLAEASTLPVDSFVDEELTGKYIDVLGLALKQDI